MDGINSFELRPAMNGEIPYLDIVVDGRPLATYFAGRLGAIPEQISPLGDGDEQHKIEQFRRLLLEAPPDLPNGRNSILVCQLCGDLGCGAYSAVFTRDVDFIRWSEFGFENDYDEESVELPIPARTSEFVFLWAQYEEELRRQLTSLSTDTGEEHLSTEPFKA